MSINLNVNLSWELQKFEREIFINGFKVRYSVKREDINHFPPNLYFDRGANLDDPKCMQLLQRVIKLYEGIPKDQVFIYVDSENITVRTLVLVNAIINKERFIFPSYSQEDYYFYDNGEKVHTFVARRDLRSLKSCSQRTINRFRTLYNLELAKQNK